MSLDGLKDRIPEYAKDLKLNLSSLFNSLEGMTEKQLWGTLVATAIASRDAEVREAVFREAVEHLEPGELNAAKTAAALMGMNNIYYRFIHLVADKEYGTLPAKLRMNALRTHGVPKVDFELWSLAVSAINGCGMCIDSHEKTLAAEGVAKSVIQHAIRIAAIVHAVAVTLESDPAEAGAGVE